jgi:hypothetical protein
MAEKKVMITKKAGFKFKGIGPVCDGKKKGQEKYAGKKVIFPEMPFERKLLPEKQLNACLKAGTVVEVGE